VRKVHTVTQGDSFFLKIPLLKSGQPWPIAGWSFWFTVKKSPDEDDTAALFQKSTAAAQIKALAVTSAYVIGLPGDTKGKDTGRYTYDIQGKSPEGDVYTLEDGDFIVRAERTRAA
jgi:hypothetical protein